jgi:hypothetical protein
VGERVTATKNSPTRTFGVRRLCRRLTVQPAPPKRSRVENSAAPPVAASFSWAIRRCLSSLTLPLRFGFRCPPERGAPSAPTRDLSSIATAPSPRLQLGPSLPCGSRLQPRQKIGAQRRTLTPRESHRLPDAVRARRCRYVSVLENPAPEARHQLARPVRAAKIPARQRLPLARPFRASLRNVQARPKIKGRKPSASALDFLPPTRLK